MNSSFCILDAFRAFIGYSRKRVSRTCEQSCELMSDSKCSTVASHILTTTNSSARMKTKQFAPLVNEMSYEVSALCELRCVLRIGIS